MAVDSQDKRYSLINIDWVGGRLLPVPDGSVSTADRLHWLGKYRGIAAGAPGPVSGINTAAGRYSIMLLDWVVGRVLPEPDGTISTADRLHYVGKYRGIAAGAPTAPLGVYIPQFRRRRR